ncbi:MAG: bifunctional ligase/repressor BirA [Pseudomonadota bacterium]|jgi:biotin-[acetyl-CoA-carboxylase] ligase BirA-like protein
MFDIQAFDISRLADLSQRLSTNTQLTVQVIPETDSTNSLLLAQANYLPLYPKPAVACLALKQSKGRGRLGRKWISDNQSTGIHNAGIHNAGIHNVGIHKNTAFTASIGFSTVLPLSHLTVLSLQVGVAVAQYLQGLGLDIALKWPNDLVLRTGCPKKFEKIGGILIETRSLDTAQYQPEKTAVVMGLGINWYAAPDILNRNTACVADNMYALPDSESVCAALLSAMNIAWQRTERKQHCEFAPFDILAGQEVTLHHTLSNNNIPIIGIAQGINAQGCLGIHTKQGLRWLHSGEVTFNTFKANSSS